MEIGWNRWINDGGKSETATEEEADRKDGDSMAGQRKYL